MEGVEGLLEKLQLSDAERKGIRVAAAPVAMAAASHQAVGKVFSEKLYRADAMEGALGKVWCPIRGIDCKELGENRFLVTFLQSSGKRRALEDGPWMISKDLVVMADLDASKSIDEIEFNYIPIWVRVTKMPLGLMNRAYGEAIGNQIGTFMEMEVDDDGSAMGQFLRIKVRFDIRTPLMRGVTLFVEEMEIEREVWCPLVYEFLPDFC